MSFLKEQIEVIREKDPSLKSNLEVLLYPSFKALLRYKVARFFYNKKLYFLSRYITEKTKRKTGIEIHPKATIGKKLFIDHGLDVVIGETAVIGDNVLIYHGVTLGATGKEDGKRHPTIGNNVIIGTGAKVLGNIKVGDNAKIGAGAIVLDDVDAGSTVVCAKAHKVK